MTATTDPERLQRVALGLAEAVAARADGKRVKLPVVPQADAAGLVGMMHAQLDDAISRRDAQIGKRMACHKGCSSCCVSPVLVTEGEAVAVAEWLREPANAPVRAHFDAAYVTWRDKLGALVAEASAPRDPDENLEWCMKAKRREAMCAFNIAGACSIYPVRPALCRKTHALDTNTYCGSDGGKVDYYEHAETEALYEQQHEMRFALHSALRPSGHLDLLCSAVHRLLGGASAGRNEPCPCGSGKKYKKCHGANA
ncbi:MAG: SEC-C metal-binding domain-containing protein [Acidobacteriota bacterium]